MKLPKMGKLRTKRFKEIIKNAEPTLITATPVHGKHSEPKKSTIIKEATDKETAWKWNLDNKAAATKDENHLHLKEHFRKHNEENSNFGIVDYTSTSHRMNIALINKARKDHPNALAKKRVENEFEGQRKRIEDVDKYLKSAPPLEKDVDVYHGLAGWHPGMESFKHPERHIKMPAFTSTSLHRETASDFAYHVPNKKGKAMGETESSRHMLHIKLKKGQQPGSYVDPISQCEGEKEFLLHRGSILKIHPKPTVLHIHDDAQHQKMKANRDGPYRRKHVYIWHAEYVDHQHD